MALFTYDGPYQEVDLKVAGNEVGSVKKGESIVVPDDLAALVEWQDYWTRADETKPDRKPVTPEVPAKGKE